MGNNLLSVIIPSRTEEYLQKTVDDILLKAKGEIEIIVILDGYWPKEHNWANSKIRIIHQGTIDNNMGMRAAINAGMSIAQGEFVMKTDEHCMFDEGFDEKLKNDCQDDWVVIPRRYRLDPENWVIFEDGRSPIDYMYLAYPYERQGDKTCGLHGELWKERYYEKKDILIDDTMSWQGSCYFLKKKYWNELIHPLDEINYGTFTQEAQEIGNKVWLSGGRLVVNKKTWYAHFHKGKRGKNYGFTNEQYKNHREEMERGRKFCIDYWLNTKDYKYDFEWLLKKFWPVPGWKNTWKEDIIRDVKFDYSVVGDLINK